MAKHCKQYIVRIRTAAYYFLISAIAVYIFPSTFIDFGIYAFKGIKNYANRYKYQNLIPLPHDFHSSNPKEGEIWVNGFMSDCVRCQLLQKFLSLATIIVSPF